MKGFPFTGAIHFGRPEITERNLVPNPPARMIASVMPPSPKGQFENA